MSYEADPALEIVNVVWVQLRTLFWSYGKWPKAEAAQLQDEDRCRWQWASRIWVPMAIRVRRWQGKEHGTPPSDAWPSWTVQNINQYPIMTCQAESWLWHRGGMCYQCSGSHSWPQPQHLLLGLHSTYGIFPLFFWMRPPSKMCPASLPPRTHPPVGTFWSKVYFFH